MMSSLYIGATGVKSHSEGMSVVANNLSNVNTVAYKQTSLQYSDMLSEYMSAGSNMQTNLSQKGAGVMPGSTRTLFIQGAASAGSEATDLSIEGGGFFGVTKGGQTHYTRAGNFRFNKSGELLDPSGWTVLGHAIKDGVEDPNSTPIVLEMNDNGEASYMPPQGSSTLTICSQLGGLSNVSDDAANPYFSMAAAWDGTSATPLASGTYSYSELFSFYDNNGDLRQATIYYDLAGQSGGTSVAEYLIAMNPEMDASDRAGTESAGLLMAGTMTFSSSGELINLTGFLPPASGSPSELSGWSAASLSADGYPSFSATPSGASAQNMSLNAGLVLSADASGATTLASAADVATDPSIVYRAADGAQSQAVSSNFYGESCSNISSKRDGHAEGFLSSVTVSTDGVIRGIYSNNEEQDLYRISMYRFGSVDGLHNEGNNHFTATDASGVIEEGVAGTENFGSIAQYALEGSNVDYAREFSLMIITQRGFQMNSKVVTTSDEMLRKALELKR